jgi:hypothetical protein
LLVAVLVINLALLVAVLMENSHVSGSARLVWVQMGLTGAAVVLLARALKVTRDLRTQVRRLSDINRLLF